MIGVLKMEFQKMTEIDKTPIIFEKGIPKKNKFIQGILFTKILLVLPFVRSIIKRWLTHCHNVYIIPGFYCFYGNIYAKNVGFQRTYAYAWKSRRVSSVSESVLNVENGIDL